MQPEGCTRLTSSRGRGRVTERRETNDLFVLARCSFSVVGQPTLNEGFFRNSPLREGLDDTATPSLYLISSEEPKNC